MSSSCNLQPKENRIIESTFPIDGISEIGARERYLHGATAHSLFVWWARRPFTAMRPVILTSLVPIGKNPNEVLELAIDLSREVIPSGATIKKAKNLLVDEYGRNPRVLDIFGGGGTIALEAGRIGCEAYSIDVNPLAHFVQKSLLEFSQTRGDLPALIQKYGKKVLDELKVETDELYLRNKDPFIKNVAFLWTRSINCSACKKTISLSGDWWVSKKAKNKVLLTETVNKDTGSYNREIIDNPPEKLKSKNWKPTQGVICPFCGKEYSKKDFQTITKIQGLQDELLCVRQSQGIGKRAVKSSNCLKRYVIAEPTANFCLSNEKVHEIINRDLLLLNEKLPKSEMPCWSGIVNPTLYGAVTYSDLFNPRQLAVLIKTIKALRNISENLKRDGFAPDEITVIVSFLSGFIDQLVDWNCRLSMWIEENQQVGRALSGPGIPMLWQYSEIDPFLDGPANLYDKLNRMVKALKFIPQFNKPAHAFFGSATKLPYSNEFFDAIITDPAYGDNIFYSALSECIYTWKRMIFSDLIPEVFKNEHVPFNEEIVAPVYKMSFDEAMASYEKGLTAALAEAHRVLQPEGVISLFFSHGTKEGWELIVRAFREAGFSIVRFWPILVERHQRPRGINSNAINVSVVIVARKSSLESISCDWTNVEKLISEVVSTCKLQLKPAKWTDEDIALSCFIESVGVIARFNQISDQDNIIPLKECINRCLQVVEKSFPALSMKTRSNGKKKVLANS